MTESLPERLTIYPMSRRNHLAFSLAGVVLLLGGLLTMQFGWSLGGLLLFMPGFTLLLFGLFKQFEPKVSLEFTPSQLVWHLRHGQVAIDWSNIITLQSLSITDHRGATDLHYLGLKVWDRKPIIDQLPPRAAKSLFHEYRSLLHVALKEAIQRQESAAQLQEDLDTWVSPCGTRYQGLKGIFAARLAQLKQYLGADLYIPATSLDRHQDAFIQLFKQYQQAVQQQQWENQNSD
ncbi:MAG: DUF2982 domain-containing protein [Gammaproteobacteria bacterium]|nr:DUF2982 domain-containing protein [Gammaproteobacteria bacterium]NVK87119.1 DUF2982 domain-containing protein [Gammaproteobacteria bacterium]